MTKLLFKLSAALIFFMALQNNASAEGNIYYALKLLKGGEYQKAICELETIMYRPETPSNDIYNRTGRPDDWFERARAKANYEIILSALTGQARPTTDRAKSMVNAMRNDAKLMSAVPAVAKIFLPIYTKNVRESLKFKDNREKWNEINRENDKLFLKLTKNIPRLCQIPQEVKTEEYSD